LQRLGVWESLLCMLSYAKARLWPVREPRNFEDWVSNQFGARLFRIFFKTYTEKVWGMDCRDISADWAAQRIKGLSLSKAILSALLPKRKAQPRGKVVKTLIDSFRYPRLGPGMMWERCAEKVGELGGEVRMGQQVTRCEFHAPTQTWNVTARDAAGVEHTLPASQVISTLPMRELAAALQPPLSDTTASAAGRLKYRDFITVAVMLKERDAFTDNWIYVHDPSVQVGRIQNFKSWSPEMVPDPALACYGLEYFCFEHSGLWNFADDQLKDLARRELVQLGLASAEDIVDACVVRQRKAYPVYDDAYAGHVARLRSEMEERFPSLHLIGRNGMHKYNNQDHSMMTAMLCVENIVAGQRVYDLWQVNEDAEYHEAGDRGSTSGLRQVPAKAGSVPASASARGWLSAPIAVFLLIAALVFPLILGLGMTRGLNHDEHQHIAAGALVAREGLIPYRDFPHFHTPYLAFAYAGIFEMTDRLLLGARLFSVACATGIVALLGATVFGLFRERDPALARWLTAGAVLLALSTSVFTHTTGRAWNQEPALLLSFAAVLVHAGALARVRTGWIFVSGLLLGLAVGTRITCAPLVAPFAIAVFFDRATRERWFALLAALGAGLAVSLGGVAWFFAVAPEATWFGNFEFAQANIAYRFDTGEPRTMTLAKKLRYVWKEIVRPDAGLFLTFVVMFAAAWVASRAALRRLPGTSRFMLLLLPFVLMGSLAPSPLFAQYFYPFFAFLILGAAWALASIPAESPWFRRCLRIGIVSVLLSIGLGFDGYRGLHDMFATKEWTPMEVHAEGTDLHAHVPSGEILTLAPIFALEGGYDIYPAFATGPFAWRVSPYVEAGKAARLKMATPLTLEATMAADPPEGILMREEQSGEKGLQDYADKHRYHLVKREHDDALWVPTPGG
jgi:protoporphyrinogen oxidase